MKHWLKKHGQGCKTNLDRERVKKEGQGPVKQMLGLIIPDFENKDPGEGEPFQDMAPGYFNYLRNERGLKERTLVLYKHYLRSFETYLQEIGLNELQELSPVILSGFRSSKGAKVTPAYEFVYRAERYLKCREKKMRGMKPLTQNFRVGILVSLMIG